LFEILAFGDWGLVGRPHALQPTADVIRERFTDIDAIFLLGDNFYPSGIDSGSTDDRAFSLFADVLAPSTTAKFYAVLGNHDVINHPEAQIAYTRVHPQWMMPGRYFFKRFIGQEGLRVCSWFIDTESFVGDQISWLDGSITYEKDNCDWLVVNGHRPVMDGGEYRPHAVLLENLYPILNRHRVHLYLSGHEHQSQVLRSSTLPTTYIISGALGDMRSKEPRGHEFLEFIDTRQVAILHIAFYPDRADFQFIKTHRRSSEPLYTGTVLRLLSEV